MAWPTVNIGTTNVDAGTDDPSVARADIKSCFDAVNGIMDARAAASGVCDLDASTLVPAARLANETWTAPTYANSWEDYSASDAGGYLLAIDGIVYLRGVIKNGTLGATAFTLPTLYRPAKNVVRAVYSNDAFARLDINADGTVVPGGPSSVGSNVNFALYCSFAVNE